MKKRLIDAIIKMAILLLFSATCVITVMAQNANNTDGLKSRISRDLALSVLSEEPKAKVIECFDVSSSGWFAVGTKSKKIYVYDQDGIFQYGYRFTCDGDYGIAFSGENLDIYLVRGDVIASYNPEGICVSAQETTFSQEILNDVIYKTSKQAGNTTYQLERDIGIFQGNYSRLVAVDESGNRTVLYDATIAGYVTGAFHYVLLFSIIAVIVLGAVSSYRKLAKKPE